MEQPRPEPAAGLSTAQSSSALSLWARVACGVVAVAAGTFGILGVFTKDASSIGVPVLLAAAVFFGYLAVSGQRLRTLKLGEYEAGFDQLADVVTRNVLKNPEVPPEAKEDVAAELESVRAELPPSTKRAVSKILTDQERAELLEREFRTQLLQLFPVEMVGDYGFLDGSRAVRLRRGERELAAYLRFSSRALDLADIQGFFNELHGPMRLLLVSNVPLSEHAAVLLKTHPRHDQAGFVQWRRPVDNGALAEAINVRLEPSSGGHHHLTETRRLTHSAT